MFSGWTDIYCKKNSKSAFLDSVEKWSMVLSQGVVGTFELATLLFLVLVLVFPSSNVRASFQRSRPELLGILPSLSHLMEQLYYRVYPVMFYQKPEAPKNPLARFNPNRNSNRKTYFLSFQELCQADNRGPWPATLSWFMDCTDFRPTTMHFGHICISLHHSFNMETNVSTESKWQNVSTLFCHKRLCLTDAIWCHCSLGHSYSL